MSTRLKLLIDVGVGCPDILLSIRMVVYAYVLNEPMRSTMINRESLGSLT